MKKSASILFLFSFCLWAADFWQSKPAAEWSDKDLQKMMSNSPWARPYSISMNGPAPPVMRGSNNGDPNADLSPAPPISEGGGGRGGRGGASPSPAAAGGDSGGGGASATIVARWQTALPVKEALVRLKYRSEAATSPEAAQLLARQETDYLLVLTGQLRPFLRGNPDSLKKALIDASLLSAKGKTALKPSDVQLGASGTAVDAFFYFPRSAPYTLDDKEVEFSTRLGDVALRYKFRLKDMVFNGKLEL
jgi:hypothetical protein